MSNGGLALTLRITDMNSYQLRVIESKHNLIFRLVQVHTLYGCFLMICL